VARFDVVIPSVGRPSLDVLLGRLSGLAARGHRVIVVDDRKAAGAPLSVPDGVEVIAGPAAGPAAARNAGWRATAGTTEWVAFLDDDVLPPDGWVDALAADMRASRADVGGNQGRITVPLREDRPPTDWERNVAGLERAAWATADMAYRRAALEAVGGFDERFRRAYREDADLALRVQEAGWRLVRGEREVTHPVRPADRWVSVRLQAGNADDVLMRALHGPGWREKAGAPPGRKRRHIALTAAGVGAAAALAARRPALAAAAGAAWLAGTAELAWARIAPGPRTPHEVATMVATSAILPPAATTWSAIGALRWRRLLLPGG
jgi:glycosyltransferase involved in cell wall biosynthesis